MSTSLLAPIAAEVNSAVRSAQTTNVTPDVPDTQKATAEKRDSFCARYPHLIREYGEPIAYTEDSIKINEMLFAAKFAHDFEVLFSPEENRFYSYDEVTGLWQHLTDAAMRLRLFRDVFSVAKSEGVDDEMPFKLTDRQLRSFLSHLEALTEARGAFNTTHGLIHVKNGMLDLSGATVELKPFDPCYRSRNQVPLAYNPAATCPRFLTELLAPALPDEDINLLQRWAGAVLLGGNQAQRLILITGLAGGGKSTILSIFEAVIGEHNIAELRPDQLGESRFEKARFISKTLLVGKDVRSDYLNDRAVSYLKSLTGGDRMTAELKGSNEVVPLRGNFALAITANATPQLRLDNDADAWRRRLLVVPFNGKKPAKPIPDFAGFLVREEGEGILKWMVDGAIAHLAELKSHGGYILSANQQARISAMLAESNSIAEFVGACVVADSKRDATSDELLSEYEAYCGRQDWAPVSAKNFRERIKQLLVEKFGVTQSHDIPRYGSHFRGYRGVCIPAGPTGIPEERHDQRWSSIKPLSTEEGLKVMTGVGVLY